MNGTLGIGSSVHSPAGDGSTDGSDLESATRPRAVPSLAIAAGAYLLLSIVVWWNVWSSHPTSTTTCGCGDSARFTWFIAWTAHAIAHGLSPFYSTFLYHPHGINLLADTSSSAVGILLAPITWAFGPVASFNIALTLAPAASALAMYVLLRRWITWSPAAFIGGLVYGFSPFVLVSLASGWIDFALIAIPPLCVLCLDDLLFRRRWRPIPTGIGLGLLLTVQFFVGTEVLLMTVGFATFGTVLVIAFGAIRHPEQLRRSASHGTAGLLSAGVTAIALLSYPTWFALDGPASFSGPVWNGFFEGDGTIARNFVIPAAAHISSTTAVGYQGPNISPQYIGIPLVAVLIAGLLIWRRDLRIWLFAIVAVTSGLLSYLHPLGGLPLAQDIIPYRYVLVTYFAIAALLCLIIQHAYDATGGWVERRTAGVDGLPEGGGGSARWVRAAAGVGVALVGLAPIVAYEAQTIPLTTQPIVLPDWFQTVAPHLTPRQVLLVLPVQYGGGVSPLAWQAENGFTYKMAEDGGPGGVYILSSPVSQGALAIGLASEGSPSFNRFTSGDVAAVRAALDTWGVTTVVIPDQPGLPTYDRVASVPLAAALITAATGRLPAHQANAWVWVGVDRPSISRIPTSTQLADCIARSGHVAPDAVERVSRCILAGA